MNMSFKALLQELKSELGEGAVKEDNDHQYSLILDEYWVMVHLQPDEEQILVAASLGPLPEGDKGELFKAMLQGQYFYHQTSGATLAVDDDSSFVVLQCLLPLPLINKEILVRSLEKFLNTADAWRQKLQSYGQEQQSADRTGEDPLVYSNSLRA